MRKKKKNDQQAATMLPEDNQQTSCSTDKGQIQRLIFNTLHMLDNLPKLNN